MAAKEKTDEQTSKKTDEKEDAEIIAQRSESSGDLSPLDKAKAQLIKYLAVFKNKKILIPTLVALMLLIGGLGYLLFKPAKVSETEKKQKEQLVGSKWLGPIVSLELSINLQSDKDGTLEYVELRTDLELKDIKPLEEIEQKKDTLTALIADWLKGKKSREIDSAQEQDRLKKRIIEMINGHLTTGKIVNVYFTKFRVTKGAFTRSMGAMVPEDEELTTEQLLDGK